MDYIAQNPYRVLGVFANDPLKVRTANIARIRAFWKVGKSCEFENDFVEIFGVVDRSEQAVEAAIAQLSDANEAEFYRCLWLHRTDKLPSKINAAADIIGSNRQRSSYGEIVNTIVAAYITDNHQLVADAFVNLIGEDDEAVSEDTKVRLLRYIIKNFTANERLFIDEWYSIFNDETTIFAYDFWRVEFNKNAIEELNSYVSGKYYINNANPTWAEIGIVAHIADRLISVIKATGEDNDGNLNADGQLALSKYAEAAINLCKRYYRQNRFWEAKEVWPIIHLLRELYRISYSSKVKEDCAEFGKKLKHDVEFLAPDEVCEQSKSIRKEIENFCDRPDETRWGLHLLNNCVPYLKGIKAALGVGNPYYLRISTQIAIDALYSCEQEVESAKRKYGNPHNDEEAARKNLCRVLQQATLLCANIRILNIEDGFANGNLTKFESNLDEYLQEHDEISFEEQVATISLDSDKELYEACNDYASWQEFVRNHPHSPYVKEAMRHIWEIEDANYPKMGLYIDVYKKAFLYYKEEFPLSHNEAKVLEAVNRFYLGDSIASPDIYRKILQLWPNHPQLGLIKERIDHATFRQCHNTTDMENYLKEFPNGLHCGEARKKIQEHKEAIIQDEYNKCRTIADYNRFIFNHPTHSLSSKAAATIEDLVYQAARRSHKFNEYYSRYPKGRYVQTLTDIEDEECYKSCKSTEDYKKYVSRIPNGKYIDIAESMIKRAKRDKITLLTAILLLLMVIIFLIVVISKSEPMTKLKPSTTAGTPYEGISSDSIIEESNQTQSGTTYYDTEESENEYANNSLRTGSKPYSSYFGHAQTGDNYIDFKTQEGCDYVAIVKRHRDGKYVNHIYIHGGERAKMYIPDGNYDVYFYSGTGWNPNKQVGDFVGGFVYGGSMQKDGPVRIVSAYLEYTLYPVANGNLRLEGANIDDVLK